ncbi:VirB3 family type IV secretion system protein [Novosphingobium sp. SG720]|uniref:VirB3 family type IV secretion system protein n=1 Tax=Novosphingobium sp. SG720 TaxID=2586998 RepID=UPI00144680A2|nr:VirB3 family type IV secretion system protein [Novosphingobium sp. SG720]NKJ44841.1 type IV secretion system protein VirB3 [Novosphingobium sp. SG720]
MSHIEGFDAPIHASLGQAILLGGAPRGITIVNGTVAAAVGLGLQQWLVGIALWAIGHSIAVLAARSDPDFAPVLLRHLRQKGYLAC